MPSQRAPRHRAGSLRTRSHRNADAARSLRNPDAARSRPSSPDAARSRRTVLLAVGTICCAVLVLLALATRPNHRRSGDGQPGRTAATDDSERFAQVGPAAIGGPGRISRDQRRRLAPVGAAPELDRQPLPEPISSSSRGAGPTTRGPDPTGSSVPTSSAPPGPAQVAQAVFDAINAARRDAGLRPLRWDAGLQTSAHLHNQAMASANTLSHRTLGEADLGTRESNAGVSWWWAGENIAMTSTLTQQGALDLEAMMLNERPPDDGHRQNILSGTADSVGVDVVFDNTHDRLWLTEDFAQTSPT
jgi:uncharacterized protein YkwD